MPYQNRVTPLSSIIADPARGDVMGNRGCLHDDHQHIIYHYRTTRWIICNLAFGDRQRKIMTPGEYTELFFLDEATALAAGHRPCAQCSHTRFTEFQQHWAAANPELAGGSTPKVDVIDDQLHRERLTEAYYARDQRRRVYLDALDDLPEGVFVALGDGLAPYLVLDGGILPWTPGGYGAPVVRPTGQTAIVLTPRSVVRAIRNGFHPVTHRSATVEGVTKDALT